MDQLPNFVTHSFLRDQAIMNNGKRSSTDGQNSRQQSQAKKKLNPNFVDWLQGLPVGWSDVTASIDSEQMETWRCRFAHRLHSLLSQGKSDYCDES